jgi:hypothetical protein
MRLLCVLLMDAVNKLCITIAHSDVQFPDWAEMVTWFCRGWLAAVSRCWAVPAAGDYEAGTVDYAAELARLRGASVQQLKLTTRLQQDWQETLRLLRLADVDPWSKLGCYQLFGLSWGATESLVLLLDGVLHVTTGAVALQELRQWSQVPELCPGVA